LIRPASTLLLISAISLSQSTTISTADDNLPADLKSDPIFQAINRVTTDAKLFLPVYRSSRAGSTLKITYTLPYLDQLAQTNVVANTGRTPQVAESYVLPLDIKIANPTSSVKFATALQVHVVSSTSITQDIPYLIPVGSRRVAGGNLGWAKLENLSASYTIVPLGKCTVGAAQGARLIAVAPNLHYEGSSELFDWEIRFSDIPESFRASPGGHGKLIYGCAVGYLEYTSAGTKYKRDFANPVQLDGGAVAGVATFSAEYDLNLEAGKSGYDTEVPLQNYLRPNCVDILRLRLFSDRSAHFVITLKLDFSDATSVDLGTIDLDYFRTKGSTSDLLRTTFTKNTALNSAACQ
jgi:hypothetical protein